MALQSLTQLHLDQGNSAQQSGDAYGWSSAPPLVKISLGRNIVLYLFGSFSACFLFRLNHMQLHLSSGTLSVVHSAEHNAFGGGSKHK